MWGSNEAHGQCSRKHWLVTFVLTLALLAALMLVDDATIIRSQVSVSNSAAKNFTVEDAVVHASYNLTPTSTGAIVCQQVPSPWKCPGLRSYIGSCHTLASMDRKQTGLPSLHHKSDDDFLQQLLESIHDQRVALVGDSLMRQWYETLTCRVGLEPRWFRPVQPPLRMKNAKDTYDLHFTNMNVPPHGLHAALGYSVASTKFPRKRKGVTKRHGKQEQKGPETMISITKNCSNEVSGVDDGNNTTFETTIEYFKIAKLRTAFETPSPEFHNMTGPVLLSFLFEEADVVIFNFGIHYGTTVLADDAIYPVIQKELFEACGEIQSTEPNKRCFYRMSMPQHWAHIEEDLFPPNFRFNQSQIRRGYCRGSFDRGVNNLVFGPDTVSLLEELSQEYKVPLIYTEDIFSNAGIWHPKQDCTHFCQDTILWDLLHERLAEQLSR